MTKGRSTDPSAAKLAEFPCVTSARYVRICLASKMTGLSEKAINGKIDEGVWREGHEWHRAPDGNRYIDLEGYNAWVSGMRKTN